MFPGWHDMACKLACSDLRTYGGGRSCCFLLGNSYGNVSSHRIEDPPKLLSAAGGVVPPPVPVTGMGVNPHVVSRQQPEALPVWFAHKRRMQNRKCSPQLRRPSPAPGCPRALPRPPAPADLAGHLGQRCASKRPALTENSVWKEPPVRLTVEKNPAASPDVSTCGVRVRVPRHLSVPGGRCPSGQPFTTRLLARV